MDEEGRFDIGPFKGKFPWDESIRTGELQRIYGRLNKAAHPEDAEAMRKELERRKELDAQELAAAEAEESAKALARQQMGAEAQAAPSPRIFWKNPGMPMPCGHPVSDLDWADQADHAKGTKCEGCILLSTAINNLAAHRDWDGLTDSFKEEVHECLHQLDRQLRAHLARPPRTA